MEPSMQHAIDVLCILLATIPSLLPLEHGFGLLKLFSCGILIVYFIVEHLADANCC